jgi:hypothetical protein
MAAPFRRGSAGAVCSVAGLVGADVLRSEVRPALVEAVRSVAGVVNRELRRAARSAGIGSGDRRPNSAETKDMPSASDA